MAADGSLHELQSNRLSEGERPGGGYQTQVVCDKLTAKDRRNIDSIIKIFSPSRNFAHNTVGFPRDVDLLIARGFTFPLAGLSIGGDVMMGTDAEGTRWIVTTLQGVRAGGKRWGRTIWYKLHPVTMVRTKVKEWTMPKADFDLLFPSRRKV